MQCIKVVMKAIAVAKKQISRKESPMRTCSFIDIYTTRRTIWLTFFLPSWLAPEAGSSSRANYSLGAHGRSCSWSWQHQTLLKAHWLGSLKKNNFLLNTHFFWFFSLTFATPFLLLCPDLSFSCWLSNVVNIVSVTGCCGSRVHLQNLRILKKIYPVLFE